MPLSSEQLEAFDKDDDFSARLAKIDYILEHGSEEEIGQYLNRAYQEASLQWLVEQTRGEPKGSEKRIETPVGVIRVRNALDPIRRRPMYVVTLGDGPSKIEIPIFSNDEGRVVVSSLRNRLDTIQQNVERGHSWYYPPGTTPEFSQEYSDSYRNVIDTLSLPLFQGTQEPEPTEGGK